MFWRLDGDGHKLDSENAMLDIRPYPRFQCKRVYNLLVTDAYCT